jgi:hypothetical protein
MQVTTPLFPPTPVLTASLQLFTPGTDGGPTNIRIVRFYPPEPIFPPVPVLPSVP